jgi:cytochrome c oxidase cbb3-type subunit 4
VNKLTEYFSTDWAAMTASDWVGTVLTVVVFGLMVIVYVYALRPKNREYLESKKYMPLDDESIENGERNGG